MGIDAESDVLIGVSQPLGYDRNRDALAEQDGCMAVSQRVQAETWKSGLQEYFF